MLVVLWRLRYKLSLRDLAEMSLVRGFEFTHGVVRDREQRLAPFITEQLRARRKVKAGCSWYVDETYIKVNAKRSSTSQAVTLLKRFVNPTLRSVSFRISSSDVIAHRLKTVALSWFRLLCSRYASSGVSEIQPPFYSGDAPSHSWITFGPVPQVRESPVVAGRG